MTAIIENDNKEFISKFNNEIDDQMMIISLYIIVCFKKMQKMSVTHLEFTYNRLAFNFLVSLAIGF